jgi:molecular chaperone IbpA
MTNANARTFDLVPLQRYAVGFDQLFNELDRYYMNSAQNNSYPPYNIIKNDDDTFFIEIAAAGFKEDELEVTVDQGHLVISGSANRTDERNFVYKGIGMRNFSRSFRLADHIEIGEAKLADGLLTVELNRIVPEELKPRRIQIKS